MWEINDRYSNNRENGLKIGECLRTDKLTVRTLFNGVVLPYRRERSMTYGLGGIVQGGEFVQESAFYLPFNETERADWGGYYLYEEKGIETLREKVIFAGFINNNEWGHFLTDWSTRLWYGVREDTESRIVFCQRGDQPIHENIQMLLKYAGVPEERLYIVKEGDAPVRFSRIEIPEAALSPKGLAREFLLTFEKIREQIGRQKLVLTAYDRVYLSRTLLQPQKEIGEKELEGYFREIGFHVVHPEQLSVEEQIFYFSNALEVASLDGTLTHNILFSPRGIHQIILEKSETVNVRQLLIGQCCEIRTDYVGTYPRLKIRDVDTRGPFLVGITKQFRLYVKEAGYREPGKSKVMLWVGHYLHYVLKWVMTRIDNVIDKIKRHANCIKPNYLL